jgi:hypothetical protein
MSLVIDKFSKSLSLGSIKKLLVGLLFYPVAYEEMRDKVKNML